MLSSMEDIEMKKTYKSTKNVDYLVENYIWRELYFKEEFLNLGR